MEFSLDDDDDDEYGGHADERVSVFVRWMGKVYSCVCVFLFEFHFERTCNDGPDNWYTVCGFTPLAVLIYTYSSCMLH